MESTMIFSVVLCFLGLSNVASGFPYPKTATCEFFNTTGVLPIYGIITLTQENGSVFEQRIHQNTTITVSLKGFDSSTTKKHGFHVHDYGDISDQCANVGFHYDPANFTHGGPMDIMRHAGDLGNVEVVNGAVETTIYDHLVTMFGHPSVIGRSFVIHENEDDLGRGNNTESLRSGNAGRILSCCTVVETTMTTAESTSTTTAGASSLASVSSLLLMLIATFIMHH